MALIDYPSENLADRVEHPPEPSTNASGSPPVEPGEPGPDRIRVDASEVRTPAGEEAQGTRRTGGGGRGRTSVLEILVLVLFALVLALTLKTYVAEAYEIKGRSMLPTFHSGERVVVLKLFYEIERGDIVIFSSSEDAAKDLIKRVVGLPGEEVLIRDGRVYIDGKALVEDYREESGLDRAEFFPRTKMKVDEYFVLGDNRGDSYDSRRFRGVKLQSIKGKVIVRWWPLDQIGSF